MTARYATDTHTRTNTHLNLSIEKKIILFFLSCLFIFFASSANLSMRAAFLLVAPGKVNNIICIYSARYRNGVRSIAFAYPILMKQYNSFSYTRALWYIYKNIASIVKPHQHHHHHHHLTAYIFIYTMRRRTLCNRMMMAERT